MLGLSLNIWTDVRGITKNSGSVVSAVPVSSVVVARSSFGLKGTNIKVYTLPQANGITSAKQPATGTISPPATSQIAANSAFGIHANTIHQSVLQINTIANVNIVKITTG